MDRTGEKWTLERLTALTRKQVIELWHTLPAPDLGELDGEYAGHALDGGDEDVRRRLDLEMFDETSRQGFWLGKAYSPSAGEGYNFWRKPGGRVIRHLRFGTGIAPSLIDGKPALVMRYGAFRNAPGATDLVDEIRKLDDGLYVGAATTATPGGARSAPDCFALTGPIGSWIGVLDERWERK